MGVSKSELFNSQQNEIAQVAKVLAHPARVAILQYISRQDACICSDLVEETGLAQATISQHLSEIKKIGLLKGNFQGKNLCYCIDKDRWETFSTLFESFFNRISQQCC
ncbi:ArsR/SmtB family transcription factor [Robiginitalea sediminis]|uniref:ArsR/SmtB family transcription factor n=1 Tax=Robiginitalea sediminis TaxID=1982593 RepID=UPI000B4B08D2|nr:metalloregulator ArsR/SmtB family transcription factor [Robiginitalea sediminis]